jgi:hypothetical protein
MNQPDLFAPAETIPHGATEAEIANFSAHLISHGWQTRREIVVALGWDDRKIRQVAQAMGGRVVRCQLGYKLTASCDRNDIPHMTQAADAAGSQSAIQRAYELAMRHAIHALVG